MGDKRLCQVFAAIGSKDPHYKACKAFNLFKMKQWDAKTACAGQIYFEVTEGVLVGGGQVTEGGGGTDLCTILLPENWTG